MATKITVEVDGEGSCVFFFDKCTFQLERGLAYKYMPGECGPTSLVPNEHQRMSLKAWAGCREFEDFIHTQDVFP